MTWNDTYRNYPDKGRQIPKPRRNDAKEIQRRVLIGKLVRCLSQVIEAKRRDHAVAVHESRSDAMWEWARKKYPRKAANYRKPGESPRECLLRLGRETMEGERQ